MTVTSKITYSDQFNITYGTAQGSCLGLLLFLIFCNDIHLLLLYGHIILFADDTNLLCNHRDKKFLQYMLQHDMEHPNIWFSSNQLSLNMAKTVMMTFWNTPKLNVHINQTSIPNVDQTKLLGVTLDRNLVWTQHINMLHTKLTANKLLHINQNNL